MDPDFTQEMAQKSIDTEKIIVYSSYPIKDGIFVSPSKMEASQYAGGDDYANLQKAVKEYAESKGDYQKVYDKISKLYKNVEGANIDNEVTSELIGDYLFTDKDFINKLSIEDKTSFQKAFDEIKYLSKVATSGSKEKRQFEKVKKDFQEIYKQNVADTSEEIAPQPQTKENSPVDVEDVKVPKKAVKTENIEPKKEDIAPVKTQTSDEVDPYEDFGNHAEEYYEEYQKELKETGKKYSLANKDKKEYNNIQVDNEGLYINDKKEYGTIRTTIRKQQAIPKENNNKIDSVYSAKNYYLYEDNGFDNYKITTKIPIEGNEELITYIESEVKNGTYDTSETVDSIIETLYNGREKYNTNNVDAERRNSAMEDGGLYSREQRDSNQRFNNEEGYGNSKTGELDNSSFSLSENTSGFKQKQLDIINKSNPAPDDNHTWIRSTDDIKTFNEAFFEDGEYSGMDPDFTQEMAQKSIDTGKITVYSSYPIEDGIFVSHSKTEASQYAGGDESKLYINYQININQ